MIVKCDYCGGEIKRKKSHVERTNLHFCNVECKHNYNKEILDTLKSIEKKLD